MCCMPSQTTLAGHPELANPSTCCRRAFEQHISWGVGIVPEDMTKCAQQLFLRLADAMVCRRGGLRHHGLAREKTFCI